MSDENLINKTDEKSIKDISNLSIESEMQNCYLDYAMSVIIGRALPDIRDGLKPVHRRILYSMNEQNILYNKPYVKSARVVGDVMGKYHPHGDMAIYSTMVRMAQDFSMRYELIDGQGNFGSIDGDSPAAMRYTEARLAKISSEILVDIDKDTVDFVPNYDDKLKEPTVLPTRIPNLLINGSTGIAVGMATHIPPHNLSEVIEGLKALISNPEIKNIELLKYIKGPDFPTAGFIYGREGIIEAYTKGRGVVKMRAKAEIEIIKKDKETIVVTEIPYSVNKANLIIQIADLVRNKRIDGISDIRDESDLSGMRIVIEVKKGFSASIILNNLYKFTALQSSFGIILLALANKTPKIFTLKEMLQLFISHRKEVVVRRTQFELHQAQEKAHILEGLKIAVENIDEVIKLIKESSNPEIAREKLKERFELSFKQATAVLEMRLQKLTGLERDGIIEEHKNMLELIEKLKTLLASETLIYKIILDELSEIKEKYGDERKTQIIDESTDIDIEDIISDDQVVITRTHKGYIKRSSINDYKNQKRGGKGVVGISTREEDFVETIFTTSNHSSLLIFTNLGRCFNLKVHKVPQASRIAKGVAIVNLVELAGNEKPMTVLSVREFKDGNFVFLITSKGVIKKMDIMHFEKVNKRGIVAITLKDEELISAKLIESEEQNIFLGTKKGQSIRFEQNDLRDMGRTARGVRGINLDTTDIAVGSETLEASGENLSILTITEKGYGKRTKLEEYRVQARGGKGIKTIAVTEKIGHVVSMKQVADNDEIMVITSSGNIIRMNVSDISLQGRNTQGVRIVRLNEGEAVAGVAKIDTCDRNEIDDFNNNSNDNNILNKNAPEQDDNS